MKKFTLSIDPIVVFVLGASLSLILMTFVFYIDFNFSSEVGLFLRTVIALLAIVILFIAVKYARKSERELTENLDAHKLIAKQVASEVINNLKENKTK